jgi:hypothetical protein
MFQIIARNSSMKTRYIGLYLGLMTPSLIHIMMLTKAVRATTMRKDAARLKLTLHLRQLFSPLQTFPKPGDLEGGYAMAVLTTTPFADAAIAVELPSTGVLVVITAGGGWRREAQVQSRDRERKYPKAVVDMPGNLDKGHGGGARIGCMS